MLDELFNKLTDFEPVEVTSSSDRLYDLLFSRGYKHFKHKPKDLFDPLSSGTYRYSFFEEVHTTIPNDALSIKPTYTLNEFGFRSPSWLKQNNKGIITLGCSDTFGIGTHESLIWPSCVRDYIDKNLVVYNLGIPGGTPDSSYRVLKNHIKTINSDYVFFFVPSPYRKEEYQTRFSGNVNTMLLPNCVDENDHAREVLENCINHDHSDTAKAKKAVKALVDSYELTSLNSPAALVNYNKNIDAISFLCQKYNKHLFIIPNFFYYDAGGSKTLFINDYLNDLKENKMKFEDDIAWDGQHKGRVFHKHVANLFIEKL